MDSRWLLLALALTACGDPPPLDQPNEPPVWPLENVTDVERSAPKGDKDLVLEALPGDEEGAGDEATPDEATPGAVDELPIDEPPIDEAAPDAAPTRRRA